MTVFTFLIHKMTVSSKWQSSSGFFALGKTGISSNSFSYVITMARYPMKILFTVCLTLVCFAVLVIPGLLHKKKIHIWPPSKTFSGLCLVMSAFRGVYLYSISSSARPSIWSRHWEALRQEAILRVCSLQQCCLGMHSPPQFHRFPRCNQLHSQDALGRFPSFIWDICKDESRRGKGLLLWGFRLRTPLDREENTSAGG